MTPDASARRVVVGVDGSEPAARAAEWAAGEAAARGTGLDLVHAWDYVAVEDTPASQRPEDHLRAQRDATARVLGTVRTVVARDHPDVDVTTTAVDDEPVSALVEASRSAPLLVVGTRGRGGFTSLLLGSVSLSLVANAPCPVAIVPPGHAQGDHRICLAVDTDEPEAPISYAYAAAAREGAPLEVVHSESVFDYYPAGYGRDARPTPQGAHSRVETVLKAARERFPRVRPMIALGHDETAKDVLRAARGARLLVVGARRQRHGRLSLRIGRVLHALIHHAPCPIVVVPTE